MPSTRRTFLAGAGAAALGVALRRAPVAAAVPVRKRALINPLVLQRADTQIRLDENGLYYLMGSVPEYDRLALRAAPTLAGLATAPETVIWRRPASGPLGGFIWAPELHHFDGHWYVYFAAGDSDDPFHIRTYVIASTAKDPRTTDWGPPEKLVTPWDTFTLDSTTFVRRGTRATSPGPRASRASGRTATSISRRSPRRRRSRRSRPGSRSRRCPGRSRASASTRGRRPSSATAACS
jgi:Glycosyl hydrolases family 43